MCREATVFHERERNFSVAKDHIRTSMMAGRIGAEEKESDKGV